MRAIRTGNQVFARLIVAVCVAVTSMFSLAPGSAATITNGDFEAVQIGAPFDASNPADIPGWTHSGTVGDGLLWAIGYADGGGNITSAGSGKQFVTLGGGFFATGTASWSTDITGLTPGTSYMLGFMIANEGGDVGGPQSMTVSFTSGSSTGAQGYTAAAQAANYWKTWLPEQETFMATASTATVQFSVTNQRFDMGLDDVTVNTPSAVPEPGSLGLICGGLILVLIIGKQLRPRTT